jgi:hypothetical protein
MIDKMADSDVGDDPARALMIRLLRTATQQQKSIRQREVNTQVGKRVSTLRCKT